MTVYLAHADCAQCESLIQVVSSNATFHKTPTWTGIQWDDNTLTIHWARYDKEDE